MFCGELKTGYAGEEIDVFEGEINPELQDVICHPLRLVIMADNGDNMLFSLLPVASLVTQEHIIHSPGKNVPRDIHTKDIAIFEEKIANPVLSLTELLDHDKENRVVVAELTE